LVEDTIDEWEAGVGERTSDVDILIGVLTRCRSDTDKFNKKQLKEISQWLADVAHPKRRRKSRGAANNSDKSSRREKWDKKNEKEKERKGKSDGQKQWTREERIAFHDAFMSFGRSLWPGKYYAFKFR